MIWALYWRAQEPSFNNRKVAFKLKISKHKANTCSNNTNTHHWAAAPPRLATAHFIDAKYFRLGLLLTCYVFKWIKKWMSIHLGIGTEVPPSAHTFGSLKRTFSKRTAPLQKQLPLVSITPNVTSFSVLLSPLSLHLIQIKTSVKAYKQPPLFSLLYSLSWNFKSKGTPRLWLIAVKLNLEACQQTTPPNPRNSHPPYHKWLRQPPERIEIFSQIM